AQNGNTVASHHDLVIRNSNSAPIEPYPNILQYDQREARTTFAFYANTKINARHSYKAGFFVSNIYNDLFDKARIVGTQDSTPAMVEQLNYKMRLNAVAIYQLVQPYVQWRFKMRENLVLSTGIYSQWLTLNNSFV